MPAPLIARFAAKALQLMCCFVVLAALFGVDAEPGAAKDNDVAAAQVQKDVRVILNALYAGDLETPLRFMHPRAVELIGGMDVLRPAAEIAARRFKELDMQLELLTFPQPPQFFDGEGRRFATVPTLSIISFKGSDRVEASISSSRSWKTGRATGSI